MVFPVALALMAAGAYNGYQRSEAANARQAQIDADAAEERQYRRDERARMAAMRKDVATAAAPLAVETPWQPAVDDEGNAMPQAPAMRVGTQRFDDPAAAQKAADAGNAGPARAARMAAALEKHGEYGQAAQIRSGARQEEMADLQLSEAKRKVLDSAYDRELAGARTHDALAQFVTNSKGDGQGGAIQVKPVASADGKSVTYHQINPDGSTTATPYTFSNDFNGVAQAAFMLSRGVDPKEKLTHLISTAKTDEDRKRWESEFGLKKDAETRRAKHDDAMLANDSARVGIARMTADRAGQAAEPKPMTPDSTFDAKTAADIAKDQVQKEADAARDGGKTWTAGQIAKRTDEIVQSLRQVHAARFVEETVSRTLASAQADPQKYAAAYGQAVQLGMPQQRLAALGFRPPATAQAAPQAQPAAPQRATMGAPAQAAPAAPAAAAPAQAAPPKTGVDGFADMLSKNITTPQGKALIGMHVRSRLPAIQTEIASHEKVIALPMVSGPVKEQLKAKVAALAQEAEMMQAFAAGNPGI